MCSCCSSRSQLLGAAATAVFNKQGRRADLLPGLLWQHELVPALTRSPKIEASVAKWSCVTRTPHGSPAGCERRLPSADTPVTCNVAFGVLSQLIAVSIAGVQSSARCLKHCVAPCCCRPWQQKQQDAVRFQANRGFRGRQIRRPPSPASCTPPLYRCPGHGYGGSGNLSAPMRSAAVIVPGLSPTSGALVRVGRRRGDHRRLRE